MDDSGGVHGPWCGARTYPTRCQFCGASVFYFSCDCGCKVFFDKLGWPWPIHDCTPYFQAQQRIRLQEEYASRMEQQRERRRKLDTPIASCAPGLALIVSDLGVVREAVLAVDVYKRFDLPRESPIASQLLGSLAHIPVSQVTIHAGDLASETLRSYTFLVDGKLWGKLGAVRGDLLSFTIEGRCLPGRSPYWLCTDLRWPELL